MTTENMTESGEDYNILYSTVDPNGTVGLNRTDAPTVKTDDVPDWPPLVWYGVPVLCIILFAILLIILYLFPSPKKETKNCVQRCLQKDKTKYSSVEMRSSQRAVIQQRPRTHKESVNEAFDSVSVSGV